MACNVNCIVNKEQAYGKFQDGYFSKIQGIIFYVQFFVTPSVEILIHLIQQIQSETKISEQLMKAEKRVRFNGINTSVIYVNFIYYVSSNYIDYLVND